jgi:hypothetical protein
MHSSVGQLPLLQMGQQAPSEDGEVVIAQSIEHQRRQRLSRGHDIDRPRSTAVFALPVGITDDTEGASVTGASATVE